MSQLPTLSQRGLPGDCPTDDCPAVCGSEVFSRIVVMPLIAGGTRIAWELNDHFVATNPPPHTFQLQVGRTANPLADDWEPVGVPATDTWFLIDDSQRVFGKTQWTHYRICLATATQTLFSQPQPAYGFLDFREQRLYLEIIRKELLRFRYTGQEGYLLKRKLYGLACASCTDQQTGEVRDPDCPTCLGTGFMQGYFPPMECIFADVDPISRRDELDAGQMRGTINDIVTSARMLAAPHLNAEDVWVQRRGDQRWYVQRVIHTSEMQGTPIVAKVELRLAPYSDSIYNVFIPGQV